MGSRAQCLNLVGTTREGDWLMTFGALAGISMSHGGGWFPSRLAWFGRGLEGSIRRWWRPLSAAPWVDDERMRATDQTAVVAMGPSIRTAAARAGYAINSPARAVALARLNRRGRHPTSCVIWSMQTVTARINASSWSGAISMP
jgi:hypothetical protein